MCCPGCLACVSYSQWNAHQQLMSVPALVQRADIVHWIHCRAFCKSALLRADCFGA